MDSLQVLKALGDETRYAIYRELVGSAAPLGAAELARRLGLHPNTVRLHLERLREAGLVAVEAVRRGTVGRPQHVYSPVAGAPGLGVEPPAHVVLAGLLADLAERCGATAADAAGTGRAWGEEAARDLAGRGGLEALTDESARLGFEPVADEAGGAAGTDAAGGAAGTDAAAEGRTASITFLHCPFRELAEAHPDVVCNLHRGICEGVLEAVGGGTVAEFTARYDREPCRVTVAAH